MPFRIPPGTGTSLPHCALILAEFANEFAASFFGFTLPPWFALAIKVAIVVLALLLIIKISVWIDRKASRLLRRLRRRLVEMRKGMKLLVLRWLRCTRSWIIKKM